MKEFPRILNGKSQTNMEEEKIRLAIAMLLVVCSCLSAIADTSDCMSGGPVPWYTEGGFDWRVQLREGYTWIGIPIDIAGSPFGATVIGIDIHFEISTTIGSLYVRLSDENSQPGQAYHLVEGLEAGGAYVSQTHTNITDFNGQPG